MDKITHPNLLERFKKNIKETDDGLTLTLNNQIIHFLCNNKINTSFFNKIDCITYSPKPENSSEQITKFPFNLFKNIKHIFLTYPKFNKDIEIKNLENLEIFLIINQLEHKVKLKIENCPKLEGIGVISFDANKQKITNILINQKDFYETHELIKFLNPNLRKKKTASINENLNSLEEESELSEENSVFNQLGSFHFNTRLLTYFKDRDNRKIKIYFNDLEIKEGEKRKIETKCPKKEIMYENKPQGEKRKIETKEMEKESSQLKTTTKKTYPYNNCFGYFTHKIKQKVEEGINYFTSF